MLIGTSIDIRTFDHMPIDRFPFLLFLTKTGIQLLNIEDGYSEVLIAGNHNISNFVTTTIGDDIEVHYSTVDQLFGDKLVYRWKHFSLKSDFTSILLKYG